MNGTQRIAVVVAACLGAVSCNSDQGPSGISWVSTGLQLAEITAFEIPDTIRAMDTLTIVLSAELQLDRVGFSHVQVQWLEDTLEVGVWANTDRWVGSGTMPPTSFTVLHEYAYDMPPPYPPSHFEVRFEQPTSRQHAGTVVVADE